MSRRSIRSSGFTLVELMVSISLIGTLLAVFSIFFINNYQSYLNLQQNTLRANDLSNGLQRIARVLRGLNAITEAKDNILSGFAYFTPRDTTLSKVRYFYDTSSRTVKVGVTPASGTAPNYTYIQSSEVITTIIDNVNVTAPIFTYLDLTGVESSFTTDTLKDIQTIKITLTSDKAGIYARDYQLQTAVSLRNRKTNL